jgi:hypothetical protein
MRNSGDKDQMNGDGVLCLWQDPNGNLEAEPGQENGTQMERRMQRGSWSFIRQLGLLPRDESNKNQDRADLNA